MQSKTLQQSPAPGVDNASGESTTPSSQIQGKYADLVIIDEIIGEVGRVDGFRVIVSPVRDPEPDAHVVLYREVEDQLLFKSFVHEGMTEKQAEEAMALLGMRKLDADWGFPSTPAYDYGWDRKKPKKELPFYHHKRRF